MDWGEAVEGLSVAVVNNRIHADCADVRRTSEFLSHRILRTLLREMKEEKQLRVTYDILLFDFIMFSRYKRQRMDIIRLELLGLARLSFELGAFYGVLPHKMPRLTVSSRLYPRTS